MAIPPQADFFYTGKWSPACDDALVDCLIMLKEERDVTKNIYPAWFILTACDWIKNKVSVVFSELELTDRIEMLRKRYYTFKAVLRLRGAYWNPQLKAVVAPQESWDNMLKMNTFAGAYYYEEEPIWARLACVFGFDDIKVEGQHDVVVISDNTEELGAHEVTVQADAGGEEEVNSPRVFPGPKVRRKLFEADLLPNDRESSNESGIYFIDLTSDGQLRTREEKGRILYQPTKPSGDGSGPSHVKSPRASSCGSNSPMKMSNQIRGRP
ncbi:hypothetical protein SASPL_123330 [Salvia splendens]|uniref:Myb/SANT-like domain-containing protein n=1 Tax=Salvia splendens TaxID=180675 RepID=A0A8X8XKX0_SALSN|nr:uncharacterized protein LOC121745085 [Salvia splendens]KAG6415911.1 hypothetical protein SASPL_123330 [Salvia splendens]